MLAIVNSSISDKALVTLKKHSDIILFSTAGITYDAISNHPDIFICQDNNILIVAPNTPSKFFKIFEDNNIIYKVGVTDVGNKYPFTAHYNAVFTEKYLIHNKKYSDKEIYNRLHSRQIINVNQSYTRCNLLALGDGSFITSDKGIEKQLQKHNIECLYIAPDEIQLSSFDNGFFGGACGYLDNKIFLNGNLSYLKSGTTIKAFLKSKCIDLVELYDGPVIDIGSIILINTSSNL